MQVMMRFVDLEKRMQMHGEEIRHAVEDVVNSGWYLLGNELRLFEEAYAQYVGTRFCIGVGNGLDALTLIYRAYIEMGFLHSGDEVIVPANTYIASILAISENGLVPRLVEPSPETFQIDDKKIEECITDKTKSILLVHLYGRCAYTDRVGALTRKYGLLLVEDNAQAHGCRFGTQLTGSLGQAAGHSFYPTKNLGALGDAGAVTTNDPALADCLIMLRNYGSSRKYVFDCRGRNSRMDEIQAAVLRVRLKYLDEDNSRRRDIAEYYHRHIHNPFVTLPLPTSGEDNVWHQYPLLCEDRDRLQDYLAQQGIETQVHYPIPPHQQRCYAEWAHCSLPVTEYIHQHELSLPIGPELTNDEVAAVAEAISGFKLI